MHASLPVYAAHMLHMHKTSADVVCNVPLISSTESSLPFPPQGKSCGSCLVRFSSQAAPSSEQRM